MTAKRVFALPAVVASVVAAVAVAAISPHESGSQRGAHRSPKRDMPPADVRGRAARRIAIPILMYHVVSAPEPGTRKNEAWLWVPKSSFRRQMTALKRAGYRAITLRQAFDGWREGTPLPRRPIIVSFDDGYPSQYTNARPVLRRMRWPGVLNLTTARIGSSGLSTEQVKALIADGWEIDSHTVKHTDLTADRPEQIHHEVVDSRRELQRRFGVRADFFCYPFGRFND